MDSDAYKRIRALWHPVDAQDDHGYTALMYAAEMGYTGLVQTYLMRPCNPDIQNEYGETALILAAKNDNAPAVYYLSGECDVDVRDALGNTALIYASMLGYVSIVEVLLEYDADAYIKNILGYTALDYASPLIRMVFDSYLKEDYPIIDV